MTTHDLLIMCLNEYYAQLEQCYTREKKLTSLYVPVLAFDYIARGEY